MYACSKQNTKCKMLRTQYGHTKQQKAKMRMRHAACAKMHSKKRRAAKRQELELVLIERYWLFILGSLIWSEVISQRTGRILSPVRFGRPYRMAGMILLVMENILSNWIDHIWNEEKSTLNSHLSSMAGKTRNLGTHKAMKIPKCRSQNLESCQQNVVKPACKGRLIFPEFNLRCGRQDSTKVLGKYLW